MIQDKPEPFRPLPCFSDGCKSRKKKPGMDSFPKALLRSSLKFSEVLCFSLIFLRNCILGIGVQKKRPIPEQKSSIGRCLKALVAIRKRPLLSESNSRHRLLILIIIFAESLVFESRLSRRHPHAYQFFMGVSRVLRQQHLSLLFQLVQPHTDFLHVKSLHQPFYFTMHPPLFLFFQCWMHEAEEFFLRCFSYSFNGFSSFSRFCSLSIFINFIAVFIHLYLIIFLRHHSLFSKNPLQSSSPAA